MRNKLLLIIGFVLLAAGTFYFLKMVNKPDEKPMVTEVVTSQKPEPEPDGFVTASIQPAEGTAVTENEDDTEVPAKLKKWVGEYYMETEQEEGDGGKYLAVAKIWIKPGLDANFNFWFADINTKKMEGDAAQVYGTYTVAGDSLSFEYEVQWGRASNGIDPNFTLFEENGEYFIKTEEFYPTSPDGRIPVKKIK